MQQQDQQDQFLFLGLTTARRKDWDRYLSAPIATRSSKPESVAKELEEKRARREEQAQFWPVTATVSTCVIIDQTGNEVFRATAGFSTVEGEVSYKTVEILTRLMTTGSYPLTKAPTLYDLGSRLFGLRIRDRMRVLALDALRYANLTKNGLENIPVGLWNHRPFEHAPWTDPHELIVPSEMRSDVAWNNIGEFLGLQIGDMQIEADAKAQAEVARQLALAANLFAS